MPTTPTTPTPRKSVILRVPPELLAELQAAADRNERSVNAEAVYRLKESLRRDK